MKLLLLITFVLTVLGQRAPGYFTSTSKDLTKQLADDLTKEGKPEEKTKNMPESKP